MARIRTLKPEFWTDAKTGQLSPFAKCLFLGLLNLSDDYGVLEYCPAEWRVRLFPYDSHTTTGVVEKCLEEDIIPTGMVREFSYTPPGASCPGRYLYIINFRRHQVVNKPSKPLISCWEPQDNPETLLARLLHPSRSTTTPLPEHTLPPTGALPPGKEGKGEEEEGKVYRFHGKVIKLNEQDFTRWQATYHGIPDLAAELSVIDAKFAASRPQDWYATLSGWLNKKHQGLIAKKKAEQASPPRGEFARSNVRVL